MFIGERQYQEKLRNVAQTQPGGDEGRILLPGNTSGLSAETVPVEDAAYSQPSGCHFGELGHFGGQCLCALGKELPTAAARA